MGSPPVTVGVPLAGGSLPTPVLKFMSPAGMILALIKPQFEAGKGSVGKGGVVRDPEQRQIIISNLVHFFENTRLRCGPVIPSPVLGPKGNQEYLILLSRAESAL